MRHLDTLHGRPSFTTITIRMRLLEESPKQIGPQAGKTRVNRLRTFKFVLKLLTALGLPRSLAQWNPFRSGGRRGFLGASSYLIDNSHTSTDGEHSLDDVP